MKKIFGAIGLIANLLIFSSGASNVWAQESDTVTVKVGGVLTMTGPGALWHLVGAKAKIAYFDHLNKTGGITYVEPNGKKKRFLVDFRYEDTAYDPKKVAVAFTRLKDWGAHLIVEDGSTPAAALVAPSARDKVPVVDVWTVHPDPDHYLEDLDSQYSLPNMPTNVDATQAILHIYKENVWEKKHPNATRPLKVGIVALDNAPRRLYKDKAINDTYRKVGIEVVGVALVPITVTDTSIELRRMRNAGAEVVLVDHVITGLKVVLEDAQRIGVRDDMDFISWYLELPQLLEEPGLFNKIYNPAGLPEYYSADRMKRAEEAGKKYLATDPNYWKNRVDQAMVTEHTMTYTMDSIKAVLEKYGFEGLTRERIRAELFSQKIVDTGVHLKFTLDPKAPLTMPYTYLYQLDVKNGGYISVGKPAASGPTKFQLRWNPFDDPKVVETNYYK